MYKYMYLLQINKSFISLYFMIGLQINKWRKIITQTINITHKIGNRLIFYTQILNELLNLGEWGSEIRVDRCFPNTIGKTNHVIFNICVNIIGFRFLSDFKIITDSRWTPV